jgi:hypothetical protein
MRRTTDAQLKWSSGATEGAHPLESQERLREALCSIARAVFSDVLFSLTSRCVWNRQAADLVMNTNVPKFS